jgi:hypothetical protein
MPGAPIGYERTKSKSIGLAPFAGYFILDNLPVGLELLYNNSSSNSSLGNYFSRSFSFVPIIRYYIGKGQFKPYIHAGIGPGFSKTGTPNGTLPQLIENSKLLIWEVKGGVEFLANKHIGLDFNFGYKSTTEYYKDAMADGSYTRWKNITKGTTATAAVVIHL